MNNIKIHRLTSGAAPFVGGAAAILLAAAIVFAPDSSFASSLKGVYPLWYLVFPSPLPLVIPLVRLLS
ncbi:hypothetical protein AMQ83_09630, partial [Paenibacillus riograndensis]